MTNPDILGTMVFGPPRPTPAGEVDGQWWKPEGLCAQVGGDDWFPAAKGEHCADAVRVCLRCPVIFECRQAATDAQETYGVWGGLSVGELRSMKRGDGGQPNGH